MLKKSANENAFTSYSVCKTMSCDENSSEHDKETSSFEVRTQMVYFRYKSSILVAWINDGIGLSFFCGWGWDFSLPLEKEFEGVSCVILRWISFEFWNSLECTMPSGWYVFFSFIPFNGMILRESSSLSSPFLFVTSAKDSILRTLSSSCGAISFKIFPRWRD